MSVEVLTELDRLIQLLESPVFASECLPAFVVAYLIRKLNEVFYVLGLRLHLVDRRYSAALQETLYCLLMCLPQTEAFNTLRRRLQCLPSHMLNEPERYLKTTFIISSTRSRIDRLLGQGFSC